VASRIETASGPSRADEHFPGGVVHYLRDIGLLTERLTLAHCIHARPDELEIIAASGAHYANAFNAPSPIAISPSSS